MTEIELLQSIDYRLAFISGLLIFFLVLIVFYFLIKLFNNLF